MSGEPTVKEKNTEEVMEGEPIVLEMGALEIGIHELQIELEKCEDKKQRAVLRKDLAKAIAHFNKLAKQMKEEEEAIDGNGFRPGLTHHDLMSTDFAPIQWVVQDLIPVGATVLAGKPKVGKSFLALQLAQAVASGTPFLGMETTKAPVLMIALEDGPRRIKGRLLKQKAPVDLPIEYEFEWEHLDGDGFDKLRERVEAGGKAGPYGLVIIDTLASAKSANIDENKASQMAQLVYPLQRLAHQWEFALLLVFHHRKGAVDDPVFDIRGSGATPGAADTLIGLYKQDGEFNLRSESRDAAEQQLRVEFDAAHTASWHKVGNINEMAKGEAEQDVIGVLEDITEGDAGGIARELGKSRQAVRVTCKKLALRGILNSRVIKTTSGSSKLLYSLSQNTIQSLQRVQ